MGRLAVNGGNQLHGEITISGAKNAALPLLAAGLMAEGGTGLTLTNLPDLADTRLMIRLLEQLGMSVDQQADRVAISGAATNTDAPYDLVSQMRASILVMGPLLARYGEGACLCLVVVRLALGLLIFTFVPCRSWARLLNWQMGMFRRAPRTG